MQNEKLTYMPVNQSNMGCFTTANGHLIEFANPDPKSIDINDIAHALSHLCRFGGHARPFYSVAQHSVLVAHLVSAPARRYALLHDAPEAYLGDVIKPLKLLLGKPYSDMEQKFEAAIATAFACPYSKAIAAEVKMADLRALHLEHQALIRGNPGPLAACMENHMLDTYGWAWDAATARNMFLAAFETLF